MNTCKGKGVGSAIVRAAACSCASCVVKLYKPYGWSLETRIGTHGRTRRRRAPSASPKRRYDAIYRFYVTYIYIVIDMQFYIGQAAVRRAGRASNWSAPPPRPPPTRHA